ncbi:uncharacterized protein PgNI_08722 [Pyricularia grisea]|uniref:Uncharacterized protein n=1 Tax=Pyricularia grisea TaxID=148305 RepID=A0A6P8AU90_PYRGI|nr:uncharacterized protein PgNI_08722 [Pyricularia grisea]TLD05777.1 hypothetical protein PgNI_08722 [Pyricularia grisea]
MVVKTKSNDCWQQQHFDLGCVILPSSSQSCTVPIPKTQLWDDPHFPSELEPTTPPIYAFYHEAVEAHMGFKYL